MKFNIFLVHRKSGMILFETFHSFLYNKSYFSYIYKTIKLLNRTPVDYNTLFDFFEITGITHNNKLYQLIKHYILLPKKYKLFFLHFKFEIYPSEYSKFSNLICFILKQFLNSYLFTFCIFPLLFNTK